VAIAKGADGVVVGSALVTEIESSLDKAGKATGTTVSGVLNKVGEISKALRIR
jgi:tryptophan synthase alpha chain